MPPRISFWMLVLLLGLAGWFFFEIIRPFLPPMFLAAVLALIFRGAYESIVRRFRGHSRLAAVATTLLVLLAVILPVALALTMAAREVIRLGEQQFAEMTRADPEVAERVSRLKELLSDEQYAILEENIRAGRPSREALAFVEGSEEFRLVSELDNLPEEQVRVAVEGFSMKALADPEQNPYLARLLSPLEQYVPEGTIEQVRTNLAAGLQRLFANLYTWTRRALSNLIDIVVGFVIMAISLYYFLADGPRIVGQIKDLLPLESEDRDALLKEYTVVCRAVVFATIIAALLQGLLLGIGLWVAGVEQVFLLSSIAVITSMIPFIGAAGVYIPVAIWLVLQGSWVAGIGLAVYGALFVSTSDNVVRMFVVGERSQLHPLAVLVTALGGLKLVGLLGIFIGPLVAALFYALLTITHRRINEFEGKPPASGAGEGATQPEKA